VSTHPQVVSVTTARMSHSQDLALRQKRYMLTQAVRILCVILGVAVPAPLPVRMLLFSGAIFLPWFGVVMANAGPIVAKREKTAIVDRQLLGSDELPLRIALEPGRDIDG
jgi:hypothetical protein